MSDKTRLRGCMRQHSRDSEPLSFTFLICYLLFFPRMLGYKYRPRLAELTDSAVSRNTNYLRGDLIGACGSCLSKLPRFSSASIRRQASLYAAKRILQFGFVAYDVTQTRIATFCAMPECCHHEICNTAAGEQQEDYTAYSTTGTLLSITIRL